MTAILPIIVALGLLVLLAYRGWNLLIATPLLAALAVVLSQDGPVLAFYTQVFMRATGDFIVLYLPIFLLGAVFGKLMEASGSAAVLAHGTIRLLGERQAILAVVLCCALMTYGGVSLFVVAFAVFPLAAAVFAEARISPRLIPAAIALGAFTFTMTAMPGTPSIQNAIPMRFFGTTPFAAPGLGLIASSVMFLIGWRWLESRARRLGDELLETEGAPSATTSGGGPSAPVALLPLLVVLAVNLAFTFAVLPRLDTGWLADPRFGAADLDTVRGIWSLIAALTLACATILVLNWTRLKEQIQSALGEGADSAMKPIFNTACLVGFGSVVAALPGFAAVSAAATGLGGDNPLISLAVSTSLLAGMTGSASGGMSIALTALGDTYLQMAAAAGIAPELLHRITAVATGGLDTLPHNGAVISLLAICGRTHRESYPDIAVVAVAGPLVALVVLIALGSAFGSF